MVKNKCEVCGGEMDKPSVTGFWIHPGLCHYISYRFGYFQGGKFVLDKKLKGRFEGIMKKVNEDVQSV